MDSKTLLYTKSHEWCAVEGGTATIGVSDFAASQLGDVTYVELPSVGATVSAGKEMGSIESVKAASDLYSPVSGEVVEVNAELESAPELINQEPYGAGWMIKVKLSGQAEGLLDAAAYQALTASESH